MITGCSPSHNGGVKGSLSQPTSPVEWETQGLQASEREEWGGAVSSYHNALVALAKQRPSSSSDKKWNNLLSSYEAALLRESTAEYEMITDWWRDYSLDDLVSGYPEDSLPMVPVDSLLILDGYDLPVELNERVWREVRYFTEIVPSFTQRSLARKQLYDEMIRAKLDSAEMPRDLAWLAFVESGYVVQALSRAKANGIWQFIPATGKRYGLQVDWWVDERRDPERSTVAALRYLKDLHNEFGDWLLAMAAYNCGEGRVRRAIREQGTRNFWELSLPKETMHYVPRILAAAIVGRQPEHWSFSVQPLELPAIDTFTVEYPIPLSVVGEIVGISADSVGKLNPTLMRWTTPPSVKEFTLKIPAGSREEFALRYEKLDKSKLVRWQHHKVKSGENLGVIARRYGVTVSALQSANRLRSTLLRIGQDLIIPAPEMGLSSKAKSQKTPAPLSISDGVVTVRAGDTYFSLARAVGVTVDELKEVNQATDNRLIVGQKLKLPEVRNGSYSAPKTNGSSLQSKRAPTGKAKLYQIQIGDNPYLISRKLSVDLADLLAWNNLSENTPIYPGNHLTYYSKEDALPNEEKSEGKSGVTVWYTVQSGDTLWDIARQNNTTVEQLQSWNNLDRKGLRPGQRIKVGER